MFTDWTVRALLAVGLLFTGWLSFALVGRLTLRRVRRKAHSVPGWQAGKPTILYFTTPDCAACKSAQKPALRRLAELTGDQLRVVEVDAYAQPELAKQWGVLSVPATFVLDDKGEARFVNFGVAPAQKLRTQLQQV